MSQLKKEFHHLAPRPAKRAVIPEGCLRLRMPIYDAQTQKQIDALKLLAGLPLTPMKARSILDKVATENLRKIISGEWYPMLKSS
jgi:hypothetical protein